MDVVEATTSTGSRTPRRTGTFPRILRGAGMRRARAGGPRGRGVPLSHADRSRGFPSRIRILQSDGPCLQQRFEVGEDLGPATRHRLDELRRLSLDGMRDGEPDGGATRLQLHRADRVALGLELGPFLMPPSDHQPSLWFGLDDLSGVADGAI